MKDVMTIQSYQIYARRSSSTSTGFSLPGKSRRSVLQSPSISAVSCCSAAVESNQTYIVPGVANKLFLRVLMSDRADPRKVGKRQRTKCFTGCWTCRSRRVKCDEGQPLCRRCAQSGFECEGYGVRLNWSRSGPGKSRECDDIRSQRPGRRATGNIESSIVARGLSLEPDKTMQGSSDCTGTSGNGDDTFQASSMQPSSPEIPYTTPRPLELNATDGYQRPINSQTPSDTSFYNTNTPSFSVGGPESIVAASSCLPTSTGPALLQTNSKQANQYPLSRTPDDLTTVSLLSNTQEDGIPATQVDTSSVANHEDELHPPRSPSCYSPSNNRVLPLGPLSNSQGPDTERVQHLPRRHLDSLSVPGDEKRLIHHWVTYTSGKLVLLDSSNNPMRTLMLPMALKGLTSSSHESNAGISIFHAVCACSAYNLYELGGRTSEKYRALFAKHDHLAITHLRHNLDRVDEYVDQTFAMAIMAFFAVEAVSGTPRRWRTHVSGGLAYLNRLYARGADKETLKAFHQYLVSLAIVSGCDVPSGLKTFLDETEGLELSFPYYGASGSFLRAHDRMNFLITSKTMLSTEELDSFELQLYLNFPTAAQAPPGSTQSANASAIIHHMAKAFYYASLVFFQRSIRHASINTVQELVESGVKELEAIEMLSNGSTGSMVLWPPLVLAAECARPDLQGRMRAWFRSKSKLGFRNVVVLDELAATLWSQRARSKSDVTWQNLMMEDRFDVFRL